MPTVAELQNKLKQFDTAARSADTPSDLAASWQRLFGLQLSERSAKSFANYYREMRSSTKKMRGGGALAPASLSYGMTPGIETMNYGRFPIEPHGFIRDLDVYFRDSITADCGKQDISPTIPSGMGSNQVGGRRSRRGKKGRKTMGKRRGVRRGTLRRQRGGNLLESASMRLFNASAPPSYVQSWSNSYAGGTSPVPAPADPSMHTWKLTSGSGNMINPGLISTVSDGFDKLANPAPWQTSS